MSSQQTEMYRLIYRNIELEEQLEDTQEQLATLQEQPRIPSPNRCTGMDTQYSQCSKCHELGRQLVTLREEHNRLTLATERIQSGHQRETNRLQADIERLSNEKQRCNEAVLLLNDRIKQERQGRPNREDIDLSMYRKMEVEHAERAKEIRDLQSYVKEVQGELDKANNSILSLKAANQQILRSGIFHKDATGLSLRQQAELWKFTAQQRQLDFDQERERCNKIGQKKAELENSLIQKQVEHDNQTVEMRGSLRMVNLQAEQILKALREMENIIKNFDPKEHAGFLRSGLEMNTRKIRGFVQTIRQHAKRNI